MHSSIHRVGWRLGALTALVLGCSAQGDERAPGSNEQALVQNGVTGELLMTSEWATGFCANIVIKNDTGTTAASWRLVTDLGGGSVSSSWNTTVTTSGSQTTFGPVGWNASVPSGSQQKEAGFCANKGSRPLAILSVVALDSSGRPIIGTSGTGGASSSGGSASGGATGTAGTSSSTGGSGQTSTPPLTTDPTCSTGIKNDAGTVCCAAACGACGGTGCDTRPGGAAACCASGVTSAGRLCSGALPPCVMASTASPTPSSTGNISPLLVANNVWYNPSSDVWSAVAPAGLKLVRIGGHAYDTNFPSNAQLTTWVNAIKALGAEPMIQVSQYRTAAQAAETVRYFNVTTGNKVKYWNIGNEPWLQANRPAQSAIAATVAGYVRPTASAMKAVDPAIKIFAPDEAEYLDDMYNALLGGAQDITGKDAAGRYYIDGVSWHRYAETANLANDMLTRIKKTRARIDFANSLHGRTGANALQFGVGEFNSNAGAGGPCTFLNGQAVGRTYGSLMKYGGSYAALWSFKEGGSSCSGTDFGFLNGNNTPRPSFYHMQMISKNFSGNYADGVTSLPTSLYAFGAVDLTKIVVMLINQGSQQACNVRLNTDAVAGACQVKIDAGVPVTFAQSIGGTTSMVLVFNRQGGLTKRITYANGGTPQEASF